MSRAPQSAADRGSLRVVLLGFNFAVLAAFLLAFVAQWASLPGNRVVWFFVGVLTLIAGSLLRRRCFRVLGTFFSGAVTAQADHRVIDSGPYRWVRHPSYSAALLIVLGIALALGNWLSALVSVVTAFLAYSYRARVESRPCSRPSGPRTRSSWPPASGSSLSSASPEPEQIPHHSWYALARGRS